MAVAGGMGPGEVAAHALLSVLQLEGWLDLADMRALETTHRTYNCVRDEPGVQGCARDGCEQPARCRPPGSACGPGAAWYCSGAHFPLGKCSACFRFPRVEMQGGRCVPCNEAWLNPPWF